MSYLTDINGYPIDENGHDILEDEGDEEFLSLIESATDEELGFDEEDEPEDWDDDFDFGLEYEDTYYERDTDLGDEF